MEAWSFLRYVQPKLDVESLRRDGSEDVLVMESQGGTYRIAFDNTAACEEFRARLDALRNPLAHEWMEVRSSDPDSEWREVIDFLDTRSLIQDIGVEPDALISGWQAEYKKRVELCVRGVENHVKADKREKLRSIVDDIFRDVENAREIYSSATFESEIEGNFYCALLRIELSYLQVHAPLAFAAAVDVLTRLTPAQWSERQVDEDIVVGLFDASDFDRHLDLICHCLIEALSEGANRFSGPAAEGTETLSGLEFMRRTELVTRATLESWGSNRYVLALPSIQSFNDPLVKGCFIEEYHVTSRFVEIITPLLSRRLNAPLRQLMYRYYAEEVGHEEFERKTCVALGVSAEALEASSPLPLSSAFIDCLTEFAEKSPLAFLASVMVTEGMLGDPSIVPERLSDVGGQNEEFRKVSRIHDTLNQDLHHSSIARLAVESIGAIQERAQIDAIRRVLFILELNQRAWNQIADFYGEQKSFNSYRVR